jgi:IMP cyclohydrolase
LAVYELTEVTSVDIASEKPEGIAHELMELPYEHPICSVAAMIKAGYVEYGVR